MTSPVEPSDEGRPLLPSAASSGAAPQTVNAGDGAAATGVIPSIAVQPTALDDIAPHVERVRAAWLRRPRRNLEHRQALLRQLARMLRENEQLFADALYKDLRKCHEEAAITEIDFVINEIFHTLDHLAGWMKGQAAENSGLLRLMAATTDTTRIEYDPLGVVLIIGAVNYPLQLLLGPLVGAWAAGNVAVVKPSELARATDGALTEMLSRYFCSQSEFADDLVVVNGAIPQMTRLLEQRWDLIFFTGSAFVGRIVARAAAQFLTPCVLELGGQSAAYVDETVADIEVVARRIVWGKFLNAGQTCIGVNHVLVHPSIKQQLIEAMRAVIVEFYGENPQRSEHYGRLANERYFDRVVGLMDGGRVVVGGTHDRADLYIAPTILDDPDLESPLMREEIFGPLLPVIPAASADFAVRFITAREKPLALYVFTTDSEIKRKFIEQTSSGGLCINDTLMQISINGLPFGGVGDAGYGAYHGYHSFEVFSHRKALLEKPRGMEFVNKMTRYPPYSQDKLSRIRTLLVQSSESCLPAFPSPHTVLTFLLFVAVVVLAVLLGLKEN